ncbi:uncharacterized protein N7487_010275 [Penicillium crustosum]|uniref:uncharacterized protein n=1 Tax=Penicillium crustosum TaxID=36656 RepID=UPI0023A75A6D|nr:uncharacterized protein N7487_010275 [Penicillium crustosum]KAJ5395972.1 hypothetical protein N7487_010275 [Penicillium crustosum]
MPGRIDTRWRETAPGLYQRTATPMERWMTMITETGRKFGKEHFVLTVALRLQLKDGVSSFLPELRRAWGVIRQKHASIASVLDRHSGIWTYVATSKSEIARWLSETFIVIPFGMSVTALRNQTRPPRRPTLFVLPSSEEIVLQAPHTSIDGKGLMFIVDNLLSIASSVHQEEPSYNIINLSPSFRVAASLPPSTTTIGDEQQWTMSLPMKIQDKRWSDRAPKKTNRIVRALPESETRALLAVLKTKGLTITHAVHAAIACATKKFNTNPVSEVYAGAFNVDGRNAYGGNTLDHPATLYSTGWFPTIKVSDFSSVANTFREGYTSVQKDVRLPNVIDELIEQAMPFMTGSAPSPADALLSSLGVVESVIKHKYSNVEVMDFEIACEVLTPAIDIFLYTWRDQITLAAYFNETYQEAEKVSEFLGTVLDILNVELDLE